jgi:NAD-dependent SIR2 family protein deacetylase
MHEALWCEADGHCRYGRNIAFNSWLDGAEEDAVTAVERIGLLTVKSPSKALFAGDPVSYEQELERFRAQRRDRALGEGYLSEHWVKRNRARFNELLGPLRNQNVTPFVGAGVSAASGLPGWRSHLEAQGKTAGLDDLEVQQDLDAGRYEIVIDKVISLRGVNVFIQEIKADFLITPKDLTLASALVGLCSGLIVTTNYDRIIETVVGERREVDVPVIVGSSADNTLLIRSLTNGHRTILKIHGDVESPSSCVLSGIQYDNAYGVGVPELKRAIPRKLQKIYESRTLLFIGCSLWNDRTLRVFDSVRTETGSDSVPPHFAIIEAPEEADLPSRNQFLADVGISAIFYPQGQHEKVSIIIDELLDEMRG